MHAQKIADLLSEAVERTCPQKCAIAFSGGLDSSTLAKLAGKNSEVLLITIGTRGSHDLESAKNVARELSLPLEAVEVSKEEVFYAYNECQKIMPGELLKVELMVPVYFACKKAKEKGHAHIIFGSGAEELFIGYKRYFEYLEEGRDLGKILAKEIETLHERDGKRTDAVASHFGLSTIYPLLYPKLVKFALSLPISERLGTVAERKPLLREAASLLGVPKSAYSRPKQAMQYGSGIHKLLIREFGTREKGVSCRAKPQE